MRSAKSSHHMMRRCSCQVESSPGRGTYACWSWPARMPGHGLLVMPAGHGLQARMPLYLQGCIDRSMMRGPCRSRCKCHWGSQEFRHGLCHLADRVGHRACTGHAHRACTGRAQGMHTGHAQGMHTGHAHGVHRACTGHAFTAGVRCFARQWAAHTVALPSTSQQAVHLSGWLMWDARATPIRQHARGVHVHAPAAVHLKGS